MLLLDFRDHPGLEAHDVLILGEVLPDVFLGGFGLKGEDRTKGVLFSPVAVVGRNRLVELFQFLLFENRSFLLDSEVVSIPFPSEIVTIVEETSSPVDHDLCAADQVRGRIEFLFLESHSGVVGHDGLLRQLLASQQERVGILAGVLVPNLLHLNSVVSQEEVQSEVILLTLNRLVIPQNLERQHLPIVLNILIETTVRMATTELDLKVLLILLGVGRVDLDVFHGFLGVEQIVRHWFRQPEWLAHILEELPSELVAINHPENPLVEIDVLAQMEISPFVMLVRLAQLLRDPLTLYEQPLGNTAIRDAGFSDMDGVI